METWFWVLAAVVLLFGFVVFRGAPYVPSHRRFAKNALTDLYPLSNKDVLVDLGSGDGIILRLAATLGAKKAIGYELNPVLVGISKLLARKYSVVDTKLADFWLIDLPADTTIVYAFAVSRDMAKLGRKMQQTANTVKRPVNLVTYGLALKGKEPMRELQAHRLYVFEPTDSTLQSSQA